MFVVGLTGGIGSGKSTAARCFADLGVPVVDADDIARELVAPGQPALAAIVAAFGRQVLDEQGCLLRDRLRRQVFGAPQQRRRLEAILHPPIRSVMRQRLAAATGPYAVACIPLLVETGQRDMVDRVLVVDAPQSLQYERIRRRSGFSDSEIDGIIQSQAARDVRLAAADDVIVNSGTLEDLRRRVAELHCGYCHLAADGAK